MKVTLNKEQLAHLSRLVTMKGVNYYDVNQEMTDHVASEVEEEIERSGLAYMEAVKKVFLRYDRFHFMNIEEEKTKKIQKQSWRQARKSFLMFFTIPKIVITISLFVLFQYLIDHGLIAYLSYSFFFVLTAVFVVVLYLKRKWVGKRNYLQLQKFNGLFSFVLWLIVQGMMNLPNEDAMTQPIPYAAFSTFSFLVLVITIEIYINELKALKLQIT